MSPFIGGADLGNNSVGLATIEVDEGGMPVSIPNLLVVIHDSGKDAMASNDKTQVSRMRSGGVARRVRRLYRNRRKRTQVLEKLLEKYGYQTRSFDSLGTYEAWEARIELLRALVEPEDRQRDLLSIAIRHMSAHRGWANAWVRLESYWGAENPSDEFKAAVEAAKGSDQLGVIDPESVRFQAELAELALSPESLIRARANPGSGQEPLLGTTRRVDVVREWREICRMQRLPDEMFEEFARVAFSQEKPGVPIERIGNDWLDPFKDKKRAAIASMEHQEFKLRQMAANLATRPDRRSKERQRLSGDVQNLIVDHLMAVTSRDDRLTWRDIAELFVQVDANLLVHFQPDEQLTGLAPINDTVLKLHTLPQQHPIRQWWQTATSERRSSFVLHIADPARIAISDDATAEFEELLNSLDDKEQEKLVALKFPSGRSSHSLEALRKINAEIERTGDPYITVLRTLFGAGGHVSPVDLQSLGDSSEHPTIQRILPVVRRYLLGQQREGIELSRFAIEHVRDALLGLQAKKDYSDEMFRNRRTRERAREDIVAAGLGITNADHVDNGMVRKFEAITRQNSTCLYCGDTPSWSGMEMDHIVPRASGGNSTKANLVAVCRECNQKKGKLPFARFAAAGTRPGVTIDGAIERVRSYQKGELTAGQLKRLRAETIRRLKQTEDDEPIDERALASTAYAAVDMRKRVITSLGLSAEQVPVYSGRIVSLARRASGIDKAIAIREGLDAKSRFDRRHHAIDAAVVAMMNPSVARTLAERDDMFFTMRETGRETGWKTFEGSTLGAKESFRVWKSAMGKLAELVREKIENDELVVMQPARFSARHSALHLDGRDGHIQKPLGDAWLSSERARIVDDRTFEAVSGDLVPSDGLPEDENRTITLASGKRLVGDDMVYLFPDAKARHPLPDRSSAPLGPTVHHVRIYHWDDTKGRRKAAILRIWASDLYDLEDGIKGDLLTSPVRVSSRAVRRSSSAALRDAIHAGTAKLAGSIVVGDELQIDPVEWMSFAAPARFLEEFPERHWRFSGAETDKVVNLRPIYLASEGARTADQDPDRRLVEISDSAMEVLSTRSLRISPSSIWDTPSTLVVRRTSLGRIRKSPESGLPFTWSPSKAVHSD